MCIYTVHAGYAALRRGGLPGATLAAFGRFLRKISGFHRANARAQAVNESRRESTRWRSVGHDPTQDSKMSRRYSTGGGTGSSPETTS